MAGERCQAKRKGWTWPCQGRSPCKNAGLRPLPQKDGQGAADTVLCYRRRRWATLCRRNRPCCRNTAQSGICCRSGSAFSRRKAQSLASARRGRSAHPAADRRACAPGRSIGTIQFAFLKLISGQFLQISAPGKGLPRRVMATPPCSSIRFCMRLSMPGRWAKGMATLISPRSVLPEL